MKIKVITYNIWHGTYLEKVIEFLRLEKPDVVLLQEVGTVGQKFDGTININIFKEIGKALNMEGVFEHTFWGSHKQKRYEMGIATYSRLPIEEKVTLAYERDEIRMIDPIVTDRYFMPRKLLGVKLGIRGGLWFFNTHFTITPDATVTERQLRSVATIKEYLKKYREYVLTGDMNTPYNNETYRRLAEGITDVSNPTHPTLHPTIHKVGYLGLHVDYVFYVSKRIKHLSTRIPVVDGSDHLPVVVELEVG